MNENNAIAPKGINTLAPQASDEDALKAKYGKVYRVGLTIPVDDEHEQEFAYFFKRPSITELRPLCQNRLKDRHYKGKPCV